MKQVAFADLPIEVQTRLANPMPARTVDDKELNLLGVATKICSTNNPPCAW
jgi:hypothetical protein